MQAASPNQPIVVSRKRYARRAYGAKPRRAARAAPRRAARASKPRKVYSNKLGSALGSLIGGGIGSAISPGAGTLIGSQLGGAVGGVAQSIFRNITGMGDYAVGYNTLLGSQDPPLMHAGKNAGEVRIRHREFLGDVISHATPNTFIQSSYGLNPSIQATFPWLAPIALNFQEWSPLGIVFQFKTKSSDALNSTNTALGSVIMATSYNVNVPQFINKQQMENSQFVSTVKPSQDCLHAIECDPSQMVQPSLYIYRPSTSTQDLRWSNMGYFTIATAGCQGSAVNLGELWVTYDIVLRKTYLGQRGANLGDHWELPALTSTSDYFKYQTAQLQTSSNLSTTLTATAIKFPLSFSGPVSVMYRVFGVSAALTLPTLTGTLGATVLNILQGDTINNSVNTTLTSAVLSFTTYWNIVPAGDGTQPTITFSGGTFPTSVDIGDLIIQSMQPIN